MHRYTGERRRPTGLHPSVPAIVADAANPASDRTVPPCPPHQFPGSLERDLPQLGGAHPCSARGPPADGRARLCHASHGLATSAPGQWRPIGQMLSSGKLARSVATALRPEVTVLAIHPHPRLSRLVCLRRARIFWHSSRRQYCAAAAARSNREGEASSIRRLTRWKEANRHVCVGLDALEWKRLRRIVGLGPWGE